MSVPTLPKTRAVPVRSARHRAGFWLIAAVFLVAMAFSTIPSPLYPLYERRDGFSSFTVTIVFAAYAVGVAVSLVLVGHLSDWYGRRRILMPALALEIVAAAIFLLWPVLPALLVARFITGLGVGMLTATATAYLQELHARGRPDAGRGRFEAVSTGANIGGLGLGTLVAGALAQFVALPLRVPYAVFVGLLALGLVAVALTPETAEIRRQRPRYRPQRIAIGNGDTLGYLAAVAAAFSAFAVFGLFSALAPSFVAVTLRHPSSLLGGFVVFLLFGSAALAQTATGRLSPARRFALGLTAEAVGLAVVAAGMEATSLAIFLAGGVLAGVGTGVTFKSAIGTVAGVASPASRGETLAGLFLISYVGLIVPVMGIGIATRYVTATTATLWFAGILIALLAVVAALGRKAAR